MDIRAVTPCGCPHCRICSKKDNVRYSERMPSDLFMRLLECASDQHGVFCLEDSRRVGYADNTIAQMARRGRIERLSQGVYCIPFVSSNSFSALMAALLWPVGVRGVICGESALALWDVSDANPARIHVCVPVTHRVQRLIPAVMQLHHEELREDQQALVEAIPVVTLAVAITQSAASHVAADVVEQALRHGRERGLLSKPEASQLSRSLGISRVAPSRV